MIKNYYEDRILALLSKRKSQSIQQVAKALKIDRNTASRKLAKLLQEGKLECIKKDGSKLHRLKEGSQ